MEQRIYIDWHTHTIYSDGVDDPATVVRNSKLLGIESLAITDHDTLNGALEAKKEADQWDILLIPGVEVTTEVYHILGLGINPESSRFNSFLKNVRDLQEKVCGQRIELLQEAGIPINIDRVKSYFNRPGQRIGKYNLFIATLLDHECSAFLRNLGYEGTREDFKKLFGSKGIAGKVDKKYFVTSREAIDEIHSAGGKAIVAHPFKQTSKPQDLDLLIEEGIDGLEIQPNYGQENSEFEKYALERGLLTTYGSDYHGSSFTRPLLARGKNGYENKLDIQIFFGGENVR